MHACPACCRCRRRVAGDLALTVDGILGSILPASSVRAPFFSDPNDDMAVRSLSDCSTSSVLNGVNILFGSNSFGPRIHWRTGSQTRSFFQPAPSDARHTFWIARLSLRWSPLSPLFPSSLRHEPLVCRACFLDMMRRRPGLRRAKIANQLDPNGPMDAAGRQQAMRSVTGGQ